MLDLLGGRWGSPQSDHTVGLPCFEQQRPLLLVFGRGFQRNGTCVCITSVSRGGRHGRRDWAFEVGLQRQSDGPCVRSCPFLPAAAAGNWFALGIGHFIMVCIGGILTKTSDMK